MTLLFLIFVGSLFLKLGADTLEHPPLRIVYLVFLGAGLLTQFKKERLSSVYKSPTALAFLSFFAFQMVRLLWAWWQMGVRGLETGVMLPLNRYLSSPIIWLIDIGFFIFAFLLFKSRKQMRHLLWTLAGCAFILALTAIPPILIRGGHGYPGPNGEYSFFPPPVYFHEIMSRYFVSRFAHSNYIGDVVAMGFFPALGIFFYALQQLKEKFSFPTLALSGLLVATEALAIILFFSRATIVCFAVTFLIFIAATLLKYPSRIQVGFALAVFMLVGGFLFWAGNIQKTVKEVQTLEAELDESKVDSSSATNREGAKRAIAIFQTFPLWGVGTKGFSGVSDLYATPGVQHFFITTYLAMCHYLQVLAEEGSGAFLYFLALLAYFLETAVGLFRAKSRFQFMAGLSIAMPVFLILAHAAVKPVMEFFAIALPVYILMGVTLAVLRPDFEHS